MSNYQTIEENQTSIITTGLLLFIQLVFLALNYQWAYTEIMVEIGHSGAWSPWLVLGVVFVLITLLDFVYLVIQAITMRIQDPIR